MRGGHRLAGLVVTASLLLGVAACSGSSDGGGGGPVTSSTASPTTASDAVQLGAWAQPQTTHDIKGQQDAVTALESVLGRPLAIDHFFVPQFTPASVWSWRLGWDAQAGREPMVSFGSGVDTRRVADGQFDTALHAYADAIRASGKPVLLRYAWEMDGVNNQAWVHSGTDYIAAWKHVHAIFTGLPVKWVWAPNALAFTGVHGGVDQYYPGDDEVDWIGADGYNYFSCLGGGRDWRSFTDLFQAFAAWRPSAPQPRMVAETGTIADPTQPARMSQWVADIPDELQTLRTIKAVVYFNSRTQGCDFRLGTSQVQPSAASAFGKSPMLAGPAVTAP